MNSNIEAHTPQFWEWVRNHRGISSASLVDEARKVMSPSVADLALNQIEGRRKAARKLRRVLGECEEFLFPSSLLAEQCSDETVADFNAMAGNVSKGDKIVDLTFGLGIDAFAFARNGAEVTGIECDDRAVAAGLCNVMSMRLPIEIYHAEAEEWMRQAVADGDSCDLLYVDPARRRSDGKRAYGFEDCEPDLHKVAELAPELSGRMLVKGSPMLDVADIMYKWSMVDKLWCVGLRGECKELLLHFNFRDVTVDRYVSAVELDGAGGMTELTARWPARRCFAVSDAVEISSGMWLTIPAASVIKARPYEAIAERWPGLRRISTASHYYISVERPVGFPGRSLMIDNIYDGLRKAERNLRGACANTAVSGYPATAEALRARIGLKPLSDGSRFLVGCTAGGRKLLLWCHSE